MATSAQAMLVANTPDRSAVIQTGQPPAQMGAWLVPIPAGQTALQAVDAFAAAEGFAPQTTAYVFDLSVSPVVMTTWLLSTSWVEQS